MSINVYFNSDVSKEEGFKAIPRTGQRGEKWDDYKILGSNLYLEKGLYHMMFHSPTELIPELLLKYVEEVTFYDSIPARPARETGIYRFRSAEAEVERYTASKEPTYSVKIRAKEMTDIHQLFRMIQTGSIRPDESFECDQVGLSGSEITAELFRALDEVALLRMANENATPVLENCRQASKEKRESIEKALDYIHKVRKERWPSRTSRQEIFQTLWTLLCPETN